ncbi:MAG: PPC domain-containing protein [Anaerolineae bacterium]|nr:PPC domain-containing protein [Anaerolineae bacterium]
MRRFWWHGALLWGLALALVGAIGVNPAGAAPHAQDRIPLHYGETVTGYLDDVQFFQQYSFDGAAGDRVIITMDALSGNLDPQLLLGDASLNLIAQDDDGGEGFNARIELVLPADGVYVIEATRYGQDSAPDLSSGEYRLSLLANQQNTGSTEVRRGGVFAPLAFGETARGVLSADDGYRLFWFQAAQGDQVAVRSALGDGVQASLFLYNDALLELGADSAGREIDYAITQDGLYFVALALADPAAPGTYALTLTGSTSLPTVAGLRTVDVVYGQRLEGLIADELPAERFAFLGNAGDQVLVRMTALDAGLDPFLYLYGPDGEIVGQDDDSAGGLDAELAVVLPVTGRYTIVATRFGGQQGTSGGGYSLALNEGATPFVDATEAGLPPMPEDFAGLPQLQYGDSIGGAVGGADYFQAHVFQARAGDEIVVTMERTSGDLDALIMLMNGSLETIAQQDDISEQNRNARLVYTIPADGYYAILATRYEGADGTTSGDFLLTLNATNVVLHSRVAALLPAERLLPGEAVRGELGTNIADVYSFYAARGNTISLSLYTTGPLARDVLLVLADSSLNEVAVGVNGELRLVAQQEDLYTLIVTRQGGPLGPARGDYELSLYGTAMPPADFALDAAVTARNDTALAYGSIVTGNLTEVQPALTYTFAGQRGDRITVRMDAVDATLDPLLILSGPDGNEIVRDDDSGGDFNALITDLLLTADGEYTITATRYGGAQGTTRGRFDLILAGVPVLPEPDAVVEAGDAPDTARPIAPGQTASGTVTDVLPGVFYVFSAQAGDTIDFSLMAIGGDLDPYLALLDANQALLATDDDSGVEFNARLVVTIPADGLYYVVATRYELVQGTTTGDYLLSFVTR